MLSLSSQGGVKGNILFVFSDPAGAKALLSCAWLQKNTGLSFYFVSDRKYDFYADFEFTILDFSLKSVEGWLDEIKPIKLLTGTSLPINLEVAFIRECKKRMIYTITFIDHWTNFYKRFFFHGKLILPDQLYVIDEVAYENALKERIPNNILAIEINPYKFFLEQWRPKVSRIELLIDLGINPDDHFLLFAPEPLLKFDLQNKYGFSEKEGLENIIKLCQLIEINRKIKLVIKPHPNHDPKIFSRYVNDWIILACDSKINELIFFSEAVIGFFSNSLIESSWMKKQVIRDLTKIGNRQMDPLYHIQSMTACYTDKCIVNKLNIFYDKVY